MKSKTRVLFVGQDPADAALLELVLGRTLPDTTIVQVSEPVSFGREIERANFDLVICDERLDWTDGTGVLLEVRNRRPTTPVVILVGEARLNQLSAARDRLVIRLGKSSAGFLELPEILRGALERASAQRQRDRNQPRVHTLLAHSRIGVFRCALNGQLLEADDAFLDILGATSLQQAQDLDPSQFAPHPLKGFSETGKLYKREQPLARVDGRSIRVSLTELVSLDDQGMPVLDGLLEDISDRKTATPEKGSRRPDSGQTSVKFSSLVAHELKEPLRNIELSTRMLLEDTAEGQEAGVDRESADLVVDGVRRLRAIVDGLLALTRVEGTPQPLEPCDCNDLVKDVLQTLRVRVEECRATVTVNPLPTVRAEPQQLQLLFRNLISNAMRFQGEEPPSIEVAARQDGDDWIFSVRDNGVGIAPEAQERIFDSFWRGDDSSGTGLGLAICKEVTERHQGRIWVESSPGKGSTFYFTIPVLGTRLQSPEEDSARENRSPSAIRQETG